MNRTANLALYCCLELRPFRMNQANRNLRLLAQHFECFDSNATNSINQFLVELAPIAVQCLAFVRSGVESILVVAVPVRSRSSALVVVVAMDALVALVVLVERQVTHVD